MIKKWIDISVTIKNGMARWPSDPPVLIKQTKNIDTGDNDNVSFLSMGSHTGTHMDAPLHFMPKGRSLDKMPPDAAIGVARIIPIKDKVSIKPDELRKHRIGPGERILFKTKNSTYWKKGSFNKSFVYISKEAANYLVSVRVRAVGVDYLSVGGYHKDGVQTHQKLLKAGICIIEGLDLSGIKPGKYDLICLPLKILNSDGAPARAVIRRRK
ncbi:MAG: cyclase family protein [Candidatus Omnitrophota bacterium]|nr:cyclase family protein [Candidatus Omnitrophota bacterium]